MRGGRPGKVGRGDGRLGHPSSTTHLQFLNATFASTLGFCLCRCVNKFTQKFVTELKFEKYLNLSGFGSVEFPLVRTNLHRSTAKKLLRRP